MGVLPRRVHVKGIEAGGLMATKKTGRPIGRPKKPLAPLSIRRARGRPELDFFHDNDRYLGALVWATQAANRISLTRAVRIVAAIQCGHEITADGIDSLEDRRTVRKILSSCPDGMIPLAFGPRKTHADGSFVSTRSDWPGGNTFQKRARYIEDKIRSWLKKPSSKRWLLTMGAAFDALFAGEMEIATRIAGIVGEEKNFLP
jgi:hypothetical protein